MLLDLRRGTPPPPSALSSDRFALVLVSGAGTRFRPLSLNVPKPLFPIAGQPMVHHPISACRRVSHQFLRSLVLCGIVVFLWFSMQLV